VTTSRDSLQPDSAPPADLVPHPTCVISTGTFPGPAPYKTTYAGDLITVSWSSSNTNSCLVRHKLPSGAYHAVNPWATGTNGSKSATPAELGIHAFELSCSSPAGPCDKMVRHNIIAK
jgi:hypothetical protein